MEINANMLRSRTSNFGVVKHQDKYTDYYNRVFYLHGERDAWETLYADVLRTYRGQLFELVKLMPQVEKVEYFTDVLDVFPEIESQKKKGFFGGLKEDYDAKAKLLPKFIELHNMLKAYIKTSLSPIITDDEVSKEMSRIGETIMVPTKEKETEVEKPVAQTQTKPETSVQQESEKIPEDTKTLERPRYVLSANRDVKLLDELFSEYDVDMAHIDERNYEEFYNVQKRLCDALEASGFKGLEGGGEILLSNKARLKDLEMLDKTRKISEEQKFLLRNNLEITKKRYIGHKAELFDLLIAKYQGA